MKDDPYVNTYIVLTGRYKGCTATINGFPFVGGKAHVEGRQSALVGVFRYFERCYQAYPEGDPRIEEINKIWEEAHGSGQVSESSKSGGSNQVSSSGQPNGQEGNSSPDATPDGGSNDSSPDGEGSGSEGDGYTDPRLVPEGEGPEEERLRKAVASLDPENDTYWTQAGLPSVSGVEVMLGSGNVTREAIDAVAKGWTRELARS